MATTKKKTAKETRRAVGSSQGESGPRGRRRSEESRRAILDAALEVLRQSGYAALTTDSIAAAAGVGKQTIYRWWTGKAEVVLEALAEHARTIEAVETGDLETDVSVFFTATFKLANGPAGTGRVLRVLMAEAQLDPAFHARFRAFIDTRRAVLESILARHASRGQLTEAMVDMLFGAYWYRLLLDHAPLGPAFAKSLGRLCASGLNNAQ